jgi:hypothetical protein
MYVPWQPRALPLACTASAGPAADGGGSEQAASAQLATSISIFIAINPRAGHFTAGKWR